ncbi:peroxisomal biogenesis factor 11 [Stylonychia lemnae]|uniref:Peroxisomal biogenesis factor 11 n=1 Tax=Stylonychia lemnae TaxID=5949 RepID=A0A078B3J1_STYLE|nr:peroxisomal biogenesis factor 11 [Stylonychia lemnae]|eukprot:CDW88073.1 peroxisomal biogenesis factor 11 [Stylonychia lemnae]
MNINDVLENSLRTINTQLGRDKTCRFVQYFAKFIVPTIAAQGPQNNELKEKLEKLGGNMSLTRKVLRFGKPIPLIKGIIDRIAEHQKKPVRMFLWRILSDLFLILYFLTDHPLYFQRVGLVKMEKDLVSKIDYYNNVAWFINASLDIICDLVDLMAIQKEIKILVSQINSSYILKQRATQKSKVDSSDQSAVSDYKSKMKNLQMQHFLKLLSIIRSSVDIPVIFHFMGSEKVSSQLAGFFGTISSSISLYNLWGK